MATKNKRRKPTKQHAGRKQKETAYDRLSRETDELMDQVAHIADDLLDLLPAFKRLSVKNRRLIYGQMDFVVRGLEDALDDYYETLPESEDDAEPGRDLIGPLVGGIGMALVMNLFRDHRSGVSRSKDTVTRDDWPDAIDIEGKRIEPEPPKQLKSKGD